MLLLLLLLLSFSIAQVSCSWLFRYVLCLLTADPPYPAHNYPDAVVDGKKGKTWGPSSVQKDRHQRSSIIFADGRWSKSAPNLEKSLRHLGGHSNIGAFSDLCEWTVDLFLSLAPLSLLPSCLRIVFEEHDKYWYWSGWIPSVCVSP